MPDNFQIRSQQVAAAIETTPGTLVSLSSSDVKIRPFQSDFAFVPNYQRFTNDEVAEDIAQAADFVAGVNGSINFGCVFKGSGTVGTPPAIGVYLRACGLLEQVVNQISVSAPSGGDTKFLAGETYTATGGKTGVIDQDLITSGVLKYIVTSGGVLVTSDVVSVAGPGGTDTATTSGSSVLYGIEYSPVTTGKKTITIQRGIKNNVGTAGQDYLHRLKGAMGTARLEVAALDAMRFHGEFTGVVDFNGAGSLFTTPSYETALNAVLPKFLNAVCTLAGVTVRPESWNMELGNSVELIPDPTTGGGPSGYISAEITARAPTVSISPLRLKPSDFDDLGKLADGSLFAGRFTFGQTAGQIVDVSIQNLQMRNWTDGNRAGFQTAALVLHAVRGPIIDNDYRIYFR